MPSSGNRTFENEEFDSLLEEKDLELVSETIIICRCDAGNAKERRKG